MDDGVLAGFVVVTWGAIVVATWRRISLLPIFPALPAITMVIGFLLNAWMPWSGTIAVGVLHLAGAVAVRDRSRRASRSEHQRDEAGEQQP